ncbi:MAG: transcription termination factor Rho [Desulfobacterales bacterium]|jgi:hypothetical protein|nr:transcription termination factor Rho [Desulfobacteraceae bacterium]MBT4363439.1 transcription termination factor Rho [Desulfobacteraceae bacterium]MBT7087104.1 transcription termination factor Rho [Desulfobacterales bacterium]MBT7698144.1 transcription termination factor Rho [Desulfobacterales bacterium]
MNDKKKESKEKELEKMTAIELREVAKKIPGITGVSGMKKADLISAIKKDRGVAAKDKKKKAAASVKKDRGVADKDKKKKAVASVSDLKKQIRKLKVARGDALKAKDSKMAYIFKRRISRLKKKTRMAA